MEDEEYFNETLKQNNICPKLIIIDTLRASFEGDENNSWNAQTTMDALNRIKKKYDTTILVLHHVNAFGNSRGSSAFIGSADTELYMRESRSKTNQKVSLTVRKQNNGKKWTKLTLAAKEIQFGNDYSSIVFDLEGEELKSLSPIEEEETNEREQNILDILEDSGGFIESLRHLQNKLLLMEGTLPNRETLKSCLTAMHEKGLIIYSIKDKKTTVSTNIEVEQ